MMVAIWFPLWLYMWDFKACMYMVGLFTRMSLSGSHSCIDVLRLVIFRGGCIDLLSFVGI